MASEHVMLIVGLITLVTIAVTSVGFRVLRKKLTGKSRDEFSHFLDSLDRIRFLPVLWILASVSIGYWLVARVVISYS